MDMIATYPDTKRDQVLDELHGLAIADPYRWLEDGAEEATLSWTARQDEYARSILESLAGREPIRRRLEELMTTDSAGVPWARGGRYFFIRRKADEARHAICMRRESDEVIVDPSRVAPPEGAIDLVDVSASGRLVVYSVRRGGEDESELRIYDAERGADLDVLPRARYLAAPRGECSITADDTSMYYTRVDGDGCHVYRYEFGSRANRLVFRSHTGRNELVYCFLSECGRFLLVQVQAGGGRQQQIQIYLQHLGHDPEPRRVMHDETVHGIARFAGDELMVMTSSNAPNHRIIALDLGDGGRSGRWRDVVPESSGVIENFVPAAGRVFVQYLENVTSRLRVFHADGGLEREVSFGTLGQISKIVGRWSSREVFVPFASFQQPLTIYRYDADEGTIAVWARRDTPVDPDALELHQIWYRSKDGTPIPMFVLHQRNLTRTAHHPVMLTGYGGFGFSVKPWFKPEAVLWAELGGVYAVANIRGGGEFGVEWHQRARLGNKQVSFDDFIAAAEHLVAEGYTAPARLGMSGHSNGGLLVAAALTQRPSLFRAAVCLHPLTDMVRYHQLAAGRWWIPEYGCADDPAQRAYLHAYSPYHRVEAGAPYPAVLLRTGGMDTRVDPAHARKLTAALQASGSARPVLLRWDPSKGHEGSPPLAHQVDDLVDELAFLCWQLEVAVA
jgi:prolyl oligopeptidase